MYFQMSAISTCSREWDFQSGAHDRQTANRREHLQMCLTFEVLNERIIDKSLIDTITTRMSASVTNPVRLAENRLLGG
jgi:hypothetical protein